MGRILKAMLPFSDGIRRNPEKRGKIRHTAYVVGQTLKAATLALTLRSAESNIQHSLEQQRVTSNPVVSGVSSDVRSLIRGTGAYQDILLPEKNDAGEEIDYFWLQNGEPIYISELLELNTSILRRFGDDFIKNAPTIIASINRAEKDLQSPVVRSTLEIAYDPITTLMPARIDKNFSHSALHVKPKALLSIVENTEDRLRLSSLIANFKFIQIDGDGKSHTRTIAEFLSKTPSEVAQQICDGKIDTRGPVGVAMGIVITGECWRQLSEGFKKCTSGGKFQESYVLYGEQRDNLDKSAIFKGDFDKKQELVSVEGRLRAELSKLKNQLRGAKTKAAKSKINKQITRKEQEIKQVHVQIAQVQRGLREDGENVPNIYYRSFKQLVEILLGDEKVRSARIAAMYPTNILVNQKNAMIQFYANISTIGLHNPEHPMGILIVDGTIGDKTLDTLSASDLLPDGNKKTQLESLKTDGIDPQKKDEIIGATIKKLLPVHLGDYGPEEARLIESVINIDFETKYSAMIALRSFLHNDPDGKKFLRSNPDFWKEIESIWIAYVRDRNKDSWKKLSHMFAHFDEYTEDLSGSSSDLMVKFHCRYLIPAIIGSILTTHTAGVVVPEIQKGSRFGNISDTLKRFTYIPQEGLTIGNGLATH